MKEKYNRLLDAALGQVAEGMEDLGTQCGSLDLNNKEYIVMPVDAMQIMVQKTLEAFVANVEKMEDGKKEV